MRKRLICLLLAGLLLVSAAARAEIPAVLDRVSHSGSWPAFSFDPEAELLEILFCPVTDADAALITCGGESVLIDCADRFQVTEVLKVLEQAGVTHLKAVINSHPDYDHIGGLSAVLDAVQVDELWVCTKLSGNAGMNNAKNVCEKHGVPVVPLEDGQVISLGGAQLQVIRMGLNSWSTNNQSGLIRVVYGDRSILFTGDLEDLGQRLVAHQAGAGRLAADIMKLPHHGVGRMNEDFIAAVNPSYAVVTAAKTDRGGVVWCRENGVPCAMTDGAVIRLTTDGSHWLAEKIPVQEE